MDDIKLFLAHAIQLERDAARRFEELSHAMETVGNAEVRDLFRSLSALSRDHLKSAMARGGFRELPDIAADEFHWPEGMSPEAARWGGVDDSLDVLGALELALQGERGGHGYYAAVAAETRDPEVRLMALRFADEEAMHVTELERWVARYAA